MTTALQLVNRVRRELRWGDTAAFTDELSKVVLDRVNDAQATIFETWDWDCDIRHDGVQKCSGDFAYTTATVTNASTSMALGFTFTSPFDAVEANRGVPRVVITDDAAYGDTALRIATHSFSGGTVYIETDVAFPGSTNVATAAALIVTNEYVLPTTVRKVLSVRHQESQVRLEEMASSQVYDRIIQRPHETISDQPIIVIVGGSARSLYSTDSTYTAGSAAGQTFTSMVVYPTPDTGILLHYSYIVRRSDLVAVDDSILVGNRSLEACLVKLAFARCMQDAVGDFNPEAGIALEGRVIGEIAALHRNEKTDPGRHRVLGSNFRGGAGRIDFGMLPRNYGTGT